MNKIIHDTLLEGKSLVQEVSQTNRVSRCDTLKVYFGRTPMAFDAEMYTDFRVSDVYSGSPITRLSFYKHAEMRNHQDFIIQLYKTERIMEYTKLSSKKVKEPYKRKIIATSYKVVINHYRKHSLCFIFRFDTIEEVKDFFNVSNGVLNLRLDQVIDKIIAWKRGLGEELLEAEREHLHSEDEEVNALRLYSNIKKISKKAFDLIKHEDVPQAKRVIALNFHPDRGGEHDTFIALWAALERV